jgi:hypothetical protein
MTEVLTIVMSWDLGFLLYGNFVDYLIWRRLVTAKLLPSDIYYINQKFNVSRWYLTRPWFCLSLSSYFLEAFFLLLYRILTVSSFLTISSEDPAANILPLLFYIPWSRRGARKAVTAVDTSSIGRRRGGVHPPVLQAVMRERRWGVRVAGCCLGNACARVITNQVTLSCPSL